MTQDPVTRRQLAGRGGADGHRREAGEGVISTAIAVLIMALIGGLMWIAFQGVFDNASERISDQVDQIGN